MHEQGRKNDMDDAGSQAQPDPDQTDAMIESLRAEVAEAMEARDDATAKAQRIMADFQNYQRRAMSNEKEAKEQGRREVVSELVRVLDHVDLALSQDSSRMDVAQLLAGVKAIRDEMMKVLAGFGIAPITPAAGEEFEPGRHEAVMQQAVEGVPPGHVASMFRAGYALGDRVIRPAQVAVTPSSSA